MEQVVETPQQTTPVAPVAPAASPVETPTQPENAPGAEGTGKEVETEETPQRRESRRQRQLNRERERRITAETELRLLREQQSKAQPQTPPADNEPKRDQFESYEAFIEARATWRAEKAAEEKTRKILEEDRTKTEQEQTRGQREQQAKAWNAQIEKARDEVEDFEDVVSASEAVITPSMSQAIVESDKGALIAYHLAKNPAEAERISKLSPSKQVAAIVALEEKVAKPAKTPSNAPAPITPVGTKADVEKNPAQMTDAEYSKWRRQRLARR